MLVKLFTYWNPIINYLGLFAILVMLIAIDIANEDCNNDK